eukprot:2323140-Rhodomonas_salina.2
MSKNAHVRLRCGMFGCARTQVLSGMVSLVSECVTQCAASRLALLESCAVPWHALTHALCRAQVLRARRDAPVRSLSAFKPPTNSTGKLLMTGAIALLYDKPVTQLTLGLVVTTVSSEHLLSRPVQA